MCVHPTTLVLLDGTEVEAKDLTTGQQLLPLRRGIRTSKSYNGYEKVYDPHGGVELTHRRVAETLMLDEINACDTANVHHNDGNKLNNDPRNFSVMEFKDHLVEHETDRFEALTQYRSENKPWNKGVSKDDL